VQHGGAISDRWFQLAATCSTYATINSATTARRPAASHSLLESDEVIKIVGPRQSLRSRARCFPRAGMSVEAPTEGQSILSRANLTKSQTIGGDASQ